MIDTDSLPDNVANDIARNMGWDSGPTTQDFEPYAKRIAQCTVREAFDRFLIWNGIIGFTDLIITALDSLRAAEAEARARFEAQR